LDKATADRDAQLAQSQRLTSTMKELAEEEELLKNELLAIDAEHRMLTTELGGSAPQDAKARGVRKRGLSSDLRAENASLRKALAELHSDSSKEEEAATLARELNILGMLLQRFGADLAEITDIGKSLECRRQELAGCASSHQ